MSDRHRPSKSSSEALITAVLLPLGTKLLPSQNARWNRTKGAGISSERVSEQRFI